MLGIGTWEFPVSVMGYSGMVQMDITDNGGKYGFALRVPGRQQRSPPVAVKSVREDGNTLHIVARIPQFPGRDIPVSVTFNANRAYGMVKAPFVGAIKLNNGRKILPALPAGDGFWSAPK
jgi:hypothetical protein